MQAYPLESDYRLIDPMYSDDYIKLYDQIEFEDSKESLDEMIENGDTTGIT